MKADDLSYAGAIKAERLRGWVRESSLPAYVDGAVQSATGSVVVDQELVYDSVSVSLAGTSPGAIFRNELFCGWGEVYTPAGVSFNAIRCRMVGRNPVDPVYYWSKISVVVRGGATPAGAGSHLIAVGEIVVEPALSPLIDLVLMLVHPETGQPRILTDADLGAQYFVGMYATSSVGGKAAMGESTGVMPNTAGQSYYVTNVTPSPRTASWMVSSPNNRLAFEHLLLSAPRYENIYGPGPAFVEQIADSVVEKLGSAQNTAPALVLPPRLYGVQGREANAYFANMHLDRASDYQHDVTSSVGLHRTEGWVWTPTGATASSALSVGAYSSSTGDLLSTKTSATRSVGSTAGTGTTPSIIVVGDSLIAAGVITQTLLDIAATDAMKISLIGTRGTNPNRHEGRGGYTVSDYTTAGRTFYSFAVSGVVTAPAINAADYSVGGATVRVQEVALSGGAGTILCSLVSGPAPTGSGSLSKTNAAAGDATIAFSAVAAVSGNPFWISGALNFAGYLTANSLATPNRVAILLGTNDIFAAASDSAAAALSAAAFTSLDSLIASIRSTGAVVDLMLPPPGAAEQNAFGANYTTGQPQWRFKRNAVIWARGMIEKYTGSEATGTYLVPSNVAVDTVNGYPRSAAAPVNARSTITVERQNNGVHPSTAGYQQMADAYWAMLKCLA